LLGAPLKHISNQEDKSMNTKLWTAVGIGAGVGALTMGAITFASAQNTTPSPSSTSQSQQFDGKHGGMHETPLTGADAEKATAAAQAAVPGGTVLRVETDSEGTYEAHVRKTDGTEVEVKMDKDFNVTSVEEFTGRGGHGMHETPLTGQKATKVKAAVKAKFPNAEILRVETDADGTYEAHILKADGTEIEVKLNKNFRITGTEEHTGMGGHGPRGTNPSPSASASANA
jgi:uncharacterized membrane protein YkoI